MERNPEKRLNLCHLNLHFFSRTQTTIDQIESTFLKQKTEKKTETYWIHIKCVLESNKNSIAPTANIAYVQYLQPVDSLTS